MKELTIEEKAKAYDEAIEKIKYVMEHGVQPVLTKEDLQSIFPEIFESEDERIRKAIITFFESEDDNTTYALVPKKDILAWLEKQGQESKWTDEDEETTQHCCGAVAAADYYTMEDKEEMKNWLISLKQRIHVSSAKTCKNDTLLDLLNKMPSCITVDGIDYHFVMKKTSIYIAYYKAIGEEGSGNAIFGATAFSPIDLLTAMFEKLKEKGLLK